MSDVTHRKRGLRFEKSQLVEFCLEIRRLTFGFVPEQRNRKCFLCFGIPMLSMCVMDIMNVLRTSMKMSISHIHVWLCYTPPEDFQEAMDNRERWRERVRDICADGVT